MKKLLSLFNSFSVIFLISAISSSCEKQDDLPPFEEIKGRWVWESSSGTETHKEEPVLQEETGAYLLIEITDSQFKRYEENELIYDLPYTVVVKENVQFTVEHVMDVHGLPLDYSFSLDENRLIMREQEDKGRTHIFLREG